MGGAEVALPAILDLFEHAVVHLINYNATAYSIEKKQNQLKLNSPTSYALASNICFPSQVNQTVC